MIVMIMIQEANIKINIKSFSYRLQTAWKAFFGQISLPIIVLAKFLQ